MVDGKFENGIVKKTRKFVYQAISCNEQRQLNIHGKSDVSDKILMVSLFTWERSRLTAPG